MSDKAVDRVVERVLHVLNQLHGRTSQYRHYAPWMEGAGAAYLAQVAQAVERLQTHYLQGVVYSNGMLSPDWSKAYTALLDSLMHPVLPEPFAGSPAYFLRDLYPKVAAFCYQLVRLRDELVACCPGTSEQFVQDSKRYCLAPQSRLTWSLRWTWAARRLFIPILLIWDAMCWLGNRLLALFFMRTMIVPALSVQDWRPMVSDSQSALDLDDYFATNLPKGMAMKQTHLVDKSMLITCVELGNRDVLASRAGVKTIIYFVGNLDIYHFSLQALQDDIDSFAQAGVPCRFVLWHYPGVFNSLGNPRRPADLVRAGLWVVQHVMNGGVFPEDIVLKGHSLGGYVATHVAYCCHKLRLWVKLWSDRSLSDAPNYLFAKVVTRYDSGYRLVPWALRIIAHLIYPFAWLLSRLIRCEMPSAYFITRLKRCYVDYVLVRSSPQARARDDICVKDDTVIQDLASLDQSWWFRLYARYSKDFAREQHLYYMPDYLEEEAHRASLELLLPSFISSDENAQDRFVRFASDEDVK